MLPAETQIKRMKKAIKQHNSGDPQLELDEDVIQEYNELIERLSAGLEDHYDNLRKEKQ